MVKSPLTNALLIADAVTFPLKIIVSGEAEIQERGGIPIFSAG